MAVRLSSPVAGRVQGGAGAYGRRTHPVTGVPGVFHAGTDIACPVGTPIVAPEPGRVVLAGWAGGHALTRGRSGLFVLFRGDVTGRDWYFGHCDSLEVAPGQRRDVGHVLALSGATGNVSGPHVHLEVRTAGTTTTTDPIPFMRGRGITPGAEPDRIITPKGLSGPTTQEDDMPKFTDRLDLSAGARQALNGLESISYGGATGYAAAGGYLTMQHLPDLVAEVRALRAEVAALRKEVKK